MRVLEPSPATNELRHECLCGRTLFYTVHDVVEDDPHGGDPYTQCPGCGRLHRFPFETMPRLWQIYFAVLESGHDPVPSREVDNVGFFLRWASLVFPAQYEEDAVRVRLVP